ncbi:hypothetical protein [Natrinema salsiterrestre]|uniref:Uncharacterized protein n=1 Tax=Natrinema salsiterrestre TaxID=2950540 RepID=A0A9Q4Q357_9EURY|nr:hypothetical protein [Natrinema salsiterrestre]MDF9745923.1 hypothetical protein [Natrinema salsiterrestre]
MVTQPFEAIFRGADDRYYTEWQIEHRLRTGAWALCLRQRGPDRWLVETEDGALLSLAPVEPCQLPAGLEIRVFESQAWVVDRRGNSTGTGATVSKTDTARAEAGPCRG